jgi:hypothetical protein
VQIMQYSPSSHSILHFLCAAVQMPGSDAPTSQRGDVLRLHRQVRAVTKNFANPLSYDVALSPAGAFQSICALWERTNDTAAHSLSILTQDTLL